jgi:hypothetical protein
LTRAADRWQKAIAPAQATLAADPNRLKAVNAKLIQS